MDGTLWDATLSYKEVWDTSFKEIGLGHTVSAEELIGQMGKPLGEILDEIAKNHNFEIDKDTFLARVDDVENRLMKTLGGILYPGVNDGIIKLSNKYKLFLVSNCAKDGLKNFLKFTNLSDYFVDSVSYGENQVPKSENIKKLIHEHHLKNAVYMGDTAMDCDEAHKAGIPFVFAKYGFGRCEDYDFAFHSFESFVKEFNK